MIKDPTSVSSSVLVANKDVDSSGVEIGRICDIESEGRIIDWELEFEGISGGSNSNSVVLMASPVVETAISGGGRGNRVSIVSSPLLRAR